MDQSFDQPWLRLIPEDNVKHGVLFVNQKLADMSEQIRFSKNSDVAPTHGLRDRWFC